MIFVNILKIRINSELFAFVDKMHVNNHQKNGTELENMLLQ